MDKNRTRLNHAPLEWTMGYADDVVQSEAVVLHSKHDIGDAELENGLWHQVSVAEETDETVE